MYRWPWQCESAFDFVLQPVGLAPDSTAKHTFALSHNVRRLATRRGHERFSALLRHTYSPPSTLHHSLRAVYSGARRRRAEAPTTLLSVVPADQP